MRLDSSGGGGGGGPNGAILCVRECVNFCAYFFSEGVYLCSALCIFDSLNYH